MRDLIIIGGGLNGPVLALAAQQAGFDVTLVDPAPRDAKPLDGRAYAISKGSQRLLSRIGLWDALAAEAQPMEEIEVLQGRAGEAPGFGRVHFRSDEIEERPMGYMVEDAALRAAWWDRLPVLDWRDGTSVVDHRVEPGCGTVVLSDGAELTGRLLVACDGRASETAKRAGLHRSGRSYDQRAIVCTLEHSAPHNGCAVQVFLPEGPLALLPLTGNRTLIVWSNDIPRAELLLRLDDATFLEHLSATVAERLGQVTLVSPRQSYPLSLSVADTTIADRLVLVGDAGHGLHPVAGQGLNAGLRDVAVLVDVLENARARGEDLGAAQVLDRFASWRRFDIASLTAATDGSVRLFSNSSGLLRGLRGAGMTALNASPALRRAMIREAAGLTGQLPRLMR